MRAFLSSTSVSVAVVFCTALWLHGCLIGALPDGEDNSEWVVNADLYGTSSGDLFVAGYVSGCDCDEYGFVKRVSGRSRTTLYKGGMGLNAVWAASDAEIVAVGASGDVAIYEFGDWEEMQLGVDRTLVGVWGTSLSDVYAVGHGGLITHYDGYDWTAMSTPTAYNLNGIWGTGPDDIYAVGDAGTILHYVAGVWREEASTTTEDLNAIWGVNSAAVFAVGGSELSRSYVVLRYNGTLWQTETSGGPFHLLGIHGTSIQTIVAVGAERVSDGVEAAMVEYDGLSWTVRKPGIDQFLWDVWMDDDGLTVSGPEDTLRRLD